MNNPIEMQSHERPKPLRKPNTRYDNYVLN